MKLRSNYPMCGVLLALTLAACGSSSSSGGGPPPGDPADPGAPDARAGESSDVTLVSDLDGEAIAFTVHEPTVFVEGARYPLILEGHGYGGNRVNAESRPVEGGSGTFARLLDAGYGVISIDQRGHGESGGQIRILDPEFEGRDLIQIIDWAEGNLDWLAFRDANLLLGAIGGSYGGGFQHVILANDPKQRLDAIVPEITWHDLRRSLFPNGVFKSFWPTILSAAGNSTPGGQDPEVNEGLANGLLLNQLTDEQLELLKSSSMAGFCENNQVPRVDAMLWQSPADTLFDLTETFDNFACLSAQGGDVRLLTKNSGHDSIFGGAVGEACGALDKTQAIVDWFDEKLKGIDGRAANIPRFCFHLDNSEADAVASSTPPVMSDPIQVPTETLIALEGSVDRRLVPLMTAGDGGLVLAGVPAINLTVRDPLGAEAGDPIIFLTLARCDADDPLDPNQLLPDELQPNQVEPFRGYFDAVDQRLVGVSNRLDEGETVCLVIYASHAPRYAASGTVLAAPIEVEAFVSLPTLPGNQSAPLAN